MKAIILAAGRGSRMVEGTQGTPKCAIKIFGKRLIDHGVEALIAAGFDIGDIGIVTGYRGEQATVNGAHRFHNAKWDQTNMVASLLCADDWLKTDTCIICYSDILFHYSVISRLIGSSGEIVLPYFTRFWDLWSQRFDNPFEDLESFKVKEGRLLDIGQRPNSLSDVDGQYMGIIRISPAGWLKIKKAIDDTPEPLAQLDMTTLLQHVLTLGHDIRTFSTDEPWLECDSQSDVQLYEREFTGLFN